MTQRKPRSHPFLGAAWLAAQGFLLNAIGLFSTAYIIRRLGPLHYGEWAVAASLASTHLLMTNLGLRPLFVREVARRPEASQDLLSDQLGVRLALGGLATTSAMSVCLGLGYPQAVVASMAVACVGLVISILGSTLGDFLQASERFATYSWVTLTSGLAVTGISVAVVSLGYGPVALSAAYLTQPTVNLVLCWWTASRHVPVRIRFIRSNMTGLLRDAREVGLSQVAFTAASRAEQLMIPKLVGLAAMGTFSAGTMVADRLWSIPDSIATAYYPQISGAAYRGESSTGTIVTGMLTLALATCLPLAIVGTALSSLLATTLMPSEVTVIEAAIRLSVWTVPLMAMSLSMTYALEAAGHHQRVAWSNIRATVISLIISIVLVWRFGFVGACWSFLARPAVVGLMLLPSFRRIFPAVLSTVPVGRIVISSALLAAICSQSYGAGPVTALAVAGLGMGVYGGALVASRVFQVSDLLKILTSRRR